MNNSVWMSPEGLKFDAAYWAHQPPAVRALLTMADSPEKTAYAKSLADMYAIDVPIMVWNWDPYTTMVIRQGYGYTWVPSGMQPNIVAGPGINFPGAPAYDPNDPPPGSIKVSIDLADYPPFDPPAPVAPHTEAKIVGFPTGSGTYGLGLGFFDSHGQPLYKAGDEFSEDGKKWRVVNAARGLMGYAGTITEVA